jgi:hypothetical protein
MSLKKLDIYTYSLIFFLLAISSTPTSTSVTTYGNPPGGIHGSMQGVNCIESPSTNMRMPINPTISNNSNNAQNNNNQPQQQSNQPQRKQRLRSLDTFRGLVTWLNVI